MLECILLAVVPGHHQVYLYGNMLDSLCTKRFTAMSTNYKAPCPFEECTTEIFRYYASMSHLHTCVYELASVFVSKIIIVCGYCNAL